jgi:hypothetical protein
VNVFLTVEQKQGLVECILACPCMLTASQRDVVVGQLELLIASRIARSARPDMDVSAIVDTCQNYPTGLTSLFNIIYGFDKGSNQYIQLEVYLEQIGLPKPSSQLTAVPANLPSSEADAANLIALLRSNNLSTKDTKDSSTVNAISTLPSLDYGTLFGREQVLAQLVADLQATDSVATIAIVSMGGMGKTTLAYEVAKRVIQAGYFKKVVWDSAKLEEYRDFRLHSTGTPIFSVDSFLTKLARTFNEVFPPNLSVEERLERAKELVKATPTLLVIDN